MQDTPFFGGYSVVRAQIVGGVTGVSLSGGPVVRRLACSAPTRCLGAPPTCGRTVAEHRPPWTFMAVSRSVSMSAGGWEGRPRP